MSIDALLGLLILVTGAFTFLRAEHLAAKVKQRQKRGYDTYHREQEEIAAYPFLRRPRHYRIIGAVQCAIGVFISMLEIFFNRL